MREEIEAENGRASPEQEGAERSREGGDRGGGCGNDLLTLISEEKPPSLASSGAPGSEVEGVVTEGDEGREGAVLCPDRIVTSSILKVRLRKRESEWPDEEGFDFSWKSWIFFLTFGILLWLF